MRLDRSNVVLRPRTPASVADLALRFIFDLAPRRFLTLGLWVLLPGWLGCLTLRHVLGWNWLSVWLVAFTFVTFAQGPFTVLCSRLLFERDVFIYDVLSTYARRASAHLGTTLWTRGLVVVSLPLFGLGLWLWGRYAFSHEAVLLEGMSGQAALKRSADLSSHSSSDVISTLSLLLILQVGLVVLTEALGRGFVEWLLMMPTLTEPLEEAGGSEIALLGFLAATPLTATLRFLVYINGRTKHDGWDVQVRFMHIEAAAVDGDAS